MSRSPGDPDRIRQAQRAGTLARLRDRGLTEEQAAELVGRWEVEAEMRGLDQDDPHFGYEAERWYEQKLGAREAK